VFRDSIFSYYNLDFLLNNANVFLFYILLVLFIYGLNIYFFNKVSTNSFKVFCESVYKFVFTIVKSHLSSEGLIYFPFIFFIFLFIAFCNLIGLLPYSFTLTSHFLFTFGLSFIVFIGINIIAFYKFGLKFFGFFLPKGVPFALTPFLALLELVSYVFRVLSLSIRLFANMTSGHVLMKIIAGFSWKLMSFKLWTIVINVFLFIILCIITILETCIALLQAYVFTVLNCIYLKEVLAGGH
jgi:F-type H+-transporting ATPase subunit a